MTKGEVAQLFENPDEETLAAISESRKMILEAALDGLKKRAREQLDQRKLGEPIALNALEVLALLAAIEDCK